MKRCSQCKADWNPVRMYNHKTRDYGLACTSCLNKKFMAIMTLAKIDFAGIEAEVNGK